uniref:non-specific serine/threonine protein kinase n=1 Tax=Albugo laibachii Nc14 TaxID=890382 RepID=F0WJX9_9STRA|nr:eukaryotic translation initiation factor 2alpha kinase putative [Albugo laibachii Nc14]CCA24257.1 eukaryotic translation initiation factor 2alpha kinase putative [Albugo laibachii Nc14]|eukprot:CCA24257.1 eukaryotic translation initiation factor 2alpha kinase putative [Albugo laibachii Nc14]
MIESSQCFPPIRQTTASARQCKDTDAKCNNIVSKGVIVKSDAIAPSLVAGLVPSYDGYLYHLTRNGLERVEMSIVDIINANGPVQIVSDMDATDSGTCSRPKWLDVYLMGEKHTKTFRLDVDKGVIEPFTSSCSDQGDTFIFGRSEYSTRAIDGRNRSASKCFKISEYFLHLTKVTMCEAQSMHEPTLLGNNQQKITESTPTILVLRKGESNLAEGASIVAAYHPHSRELLWEREITDVDVVAVFGVNTNRGETFFQWQADGPSSLSSKPSPKTSSILPGLGGFTSTWRTVLLLDSQTTNWLSRHLGYGKGEGSLLSHNKASHVRLIDDRSRFVDQNIATKYWIPRSISPRYPKSSRSRENVNEVAFALKLTDQSDDGFFITFFNVVAILFGISFCWGLIAWGCYARGLSSSFSRSRIATALEKSNSLVRHHVHQLTIERPGVEPITISSLVSRQLFLSASLAHSNIFDANETVEVEPHQSFLSLSLKESHGFEASMGVERVWDGSNGRSVLEDVDEEAELVLMKRFTQVMATEAATIVAGKLLAETEPANSKSVSVLQLEGPPHQASKSYPALPMVTNGTSIDENESKTRAENPYNGRTINSGENRMLIGASACLNRSHDTNLILPAEHTDTLAHENRIVEDVRGGEMRVEEVTASDEVIWMSKDEGDDQEIESSLGSNGTESTNEEASSTISLDSEKNDAQVASNDENQVLFPVVCQSRFANEFVEISSIGEGGFGQVVLAENRLDGRKYAIKRVGLYLKNQTSKTLQKFLREVKILALLDHPHIVRYYQAWLEKVETHHTETSVFNTDQRRAFREESFDLAIFRSKERSSQNLFDRAQEVLEFGDNSRSELTHNTSTSEFADDGFDWERGSEEEDGWKEEDLLVPNSRLRSDIVDHTDSTNYDRCDHWLYIQMQYCAGKTLSDYLAISTRSMDLSKLLKIFLQISSALAHVHSCGLIHRDLKPANIFVADLEGGAIKLGDFGLTRYASNVNLQSAGCANDDVSSNLEVSTSERRSSSAWQEFSVTNNNESLEITAGVGTYMYASPEQVAGKRYNAKTDMYSLGMILFELCHPPFVTTMERVTTLRKAREAIFPAEFVWYKRCPELITILQRLLSEDPMERPGANALVSWCEELYEQCLVHQSIASPLYRSIRVSSGNNQQLNSLAPLQMESSRSCKTISGSSEADDGAAIRRDMSLMFLLQVKAKDPIQIEDTVDGASREVIRRFALPNHDLLKDICNVITENSNGFFEIKRYGLQMEDEGTQVFDFLIEDRTTHRTVSSSGAELETVLLSSASLLNVIILALEKIPGIQSVCNSPLPEGRENSIEADSLVS